MIAVDTNLLARFLLADDAAQHRKATNTLKQAAEVHIPVTVMLELAWVLSARGVARDQINKALKALISLPQARPQHPQALRKALMWSEAGIDFADALHLALSEQADTFVSFDKALARQAKAKGTHPAVVAP